MSGDKENQGAARRAVRVLFLLQGHTFEGARLKQLAEALGCHPSTTLHMLEVLQDEGVVERLPTNHHYWRLTPRVIQLARAHEQELARLRSRLDESETRYSRDPN